MHSIITKDGKRSVFVFFPGHGEKSVPESFPNFEEIVSRLEADPSDTSVMELFDLPATVKQRFETLSDRISVREGTVFLDGDPVHNALAEQIVRCLYAGVSDWRGLVAFYENILANPNEHSREMLFNWLQSHDFTITEDGMIVGYKYVNAKPDPETGEMIGYSTNAGYGIVDGEEIEHGYLPYRIGSVVTMPREKVQHDPTVACSTGLHVGTYAYASVGRMILTVTVHPRDVVSVPTDCGGQKLRVCRLVVKEINQGEYRTPIAGFNPTPEWDEPSRNPHDLREDESECYECGSTYCDGECVEETCSWCFYTFDFYGHCGCTDNRDD